MLFGPVLKELQAPWGIPTLDREHSHKAGNIHIRRGTFTWGTEHSHRAGNNYTCQIDNEYSTYEPQSNFLVTVFSLPHLLIKVNSTPPQSSPVDLHCMLIQGACIVWFANSFINTYRKEKNFILVAAFIRSDWCVEHYLMFQTESLSSISANMVCVHALHIVHINQSADLVQVYYKKQTLQILDSLECTKFGLRMYNLGPALGGVEVKKLQIATCNWKKACDLESFCSNAVKCKHKCLNGDEGQSGGQHPPAPRHQQMPNTGLVGYNHQNWHKPALTSPNLT